MAGTVPARKLLKSYQTYARLVTAVGYDINNAAVADHLTADRQEAARIGGLLRESGVDSPSLEEVRAEVYDRMRALELALLVELRQILGGMPTENPRRVSAAAFTGKLRAVSDERKDRLADAILLNGQRKLVRARYITAEEFRKFLDELDGEQHVALAKLAAYVSQELKKRGFRMAERGVLELLGPATGARKVPHCLKQILRGIKQWYTTSLIPLEEMTGTTGLAEWLEATRRRLQFRSHTAMHKAIAEATGLKYDSVHKALAGSAKPKRIRAEIKHCLETWLSDVKNGREPDIGQVHRGVPVEETQALLPELVHRFGTKEEVYRRISEKTGIKAGSVRRYFRSYGLLKRAPLTVYRCAKELAGREDHLDSCTSYLADERTRRAAFGLAKEARQALRRWQHADGNTELEREYRELRRALIVTIKEQRCSAPL